MANLTVTGRAGQTAGDTSAEAVAVAGVDKAFGGEPVLRGVDLYASAGDVVALLGPSGCGKTTLLRTVAGLERPDAGVIRLGGRVLSGPASFTPAERRRVGMVFQDWALFPHLSVRGNVGFGLSRRQRRSGRVEQALALVELEALAERMPATLSGGQQQRVALARALATRPAVLLLDEPFSNLDAALRAQIRSDVVELLRDLQITVLFVTHDQEEAFLVGDEVAVMLDGRIEQQAPAPQVYAAPATRAVATFVGEANFLTGRATGRRADSPVGAVPLRTEAHGPVDLLIRPEQLAVEAGDDAAVEAVEFYGHDAVYRVRLDAGPRLRARVIAAPVHARGDRVSLQYAGAATIGYPRSA